MESSKVINFAIAEPLDIAKAFKFVGLDENPLYEDAVSSIAMARALKEQGYRGIQVKGEFVTAVR